MVYVSRTCWDLLCNILQAGISNAMISFKINGQSKDIPIAWDELTFAQYFEMLTWDGDRIKLVSIFTGIEYDKLRTAIVSGLDRLLLAITFVNTKPEIPDYVDKCGPYKLPPTVKGRYNVQYESLAQFEDARSRLKKLDGTIHTLTKVYAQIVAIYLQKIRDGEYEPLKVPSMEEEIQGMNAYEVLSLGAFFFVRLMSLSSGTAKTFQTIQQPRKKSKPALNGSPKHSVRLRPSRKSRKK